MACRSLSLPPDTEGPVLRFEVDCLRQDWMGLLIGVQ